MDTNTDSNLSLTNSLTCNYCNKSFNNKATYIKHLRTHTGEKPYVCNFPNCGKQFSQKSNLLRHIKIHTNTRLFSCKICGKTFITSSNLQQHEQKHLKPEERIKYYCKYCNSGFFYKRNKEIHEQRHLQQEEQNIKQEEKELQLKKEILNIHLEEQYLSSSSSSEQQQLSENIEIDQEQLKKKKEQKIDSKHLIQSFSFYDNIVKKTFKKLKSHQTIQLKQSQEPQLQVRDSQSKLQEQQQQQQSNQKFDQEILTLLNIESIDQKNVYPQQDLQE